MSDRKPLYWLGVTLCLGLITASGCQSTPPPAAADTRLAIEDYNLAAGEPAIGGYSPVSYIENGVAEPGSPEHAVTYRGITYHMTSAEQVELFNADPERYEPEYGGWCAYGMALNEKFPIDPASYKIVGGRLFLFFKSSEIDALERWNNGDEVESTWKADRAWSNLKAERAPQRYPG